MEVKKEYLLLNFDENNKTFSCQGIEEPNYFEKSPNTYYPLIYYDADEKTNNKRIYEQMIPQANLNLTINPKFGKTEVRFSIGNRNYGEKEISGTPRKNKFKVAEYIEEVLNIRMAEIIDSNDESTPLNILKKLRNENNELMAKSKEAELLKNQNLILNQEISELKNKWYFKLAQLFQKV
jgi:hypothetical protein